MTSHHHTQVQNIIFLCDASPFLNLTWLTFTFEVVLNCVILNLSCIFPDTEYRITITISEEVHDTYYDRYKPLYVTIKGNLGETKEHECPRNYNPASSVTCAVKDQISIGKFMCLAFDVKKNTWGAQITFTRVS